MLARRQRPFNPNRQQAPLTTSDKRFVAEYLIDLNPGDAAERAGLKRSDGQRLLSRSTIQRAISYAKRAGLTRNDIYADAALRSWYALATADIRELFEIRRVNCRHCHGEDHDYQFTPAELRQAVREHDLNALRYPGNPEYARPFDIRAGDGYDRIRDPNPECPECRGLGEPHVIVHDTRNLSPGALRLLDGFKHTPNGGIELKTADRLPAERYLAEFGRAFAPRRPIDDFHPKHMSDNQLDEVLVVMAEQGTIEIEGVATTVLDADLLELTDANPDR